MKMNSKIKKFMAFISAACLTTTLQFVQLPSITASAAALTTSRVSVHDPSIVKANTSSVLIEQMQFHQT